jgi:hypothetical protein
LTSAVITTPVQTVLPQDTITLSSEKDNAVIVRETVTLRYVSTDTAEEKGTQTATVKPVVAPSVSRCSEENKFKSGAADSQAVIKPPKKRKIELLDNRSGTNRLPAQKLSNYITGLSISFNSVLNSEVNDLVLVNHLDDISRYANWGMPRLFYMFENFCNN